MSSNGLSVSFHYKEDEHYFGVVFESEKVPNNFIKAHYGLGTEQFVEVAKYLKEQLFIRLRSS